MPRPVVRLRLSRQGSAVASLRRVVAIPPGLLHAFALPGKRYDRRSPGWQWHACTVPRRHGWSVCRCVRPRASASRLISRVGRWVGIFLPAPGRLSILLIEASANILTADTGPILLVTSVSSPASLRARRGSRDILAGHPAHLRKARHISRRVGLSRHTLSVRSPPLPSCFGDHCLHGTLDCLLEVGLACVRVLFPEVSQPLSKASQSFPGLAAGRCGRFRDLRHLLRR